MPLSELLSYDQNTEAVFDCGLRARHQTRRTHPRPLAERRSPTGLAEKRSAPPPSLPRESEVVHESSSGCVCEIALNRTGTGSQPRTVISWRWDQFCDELDQFFSSHEAIISLRFDGGSGGAACAFCKSAQLMSAENARTSEMVRSARGAAGAAWAQSQLLMLLESVRSDDAPLSTSERKAADHFSSAAYMRADLPNLLTRSTLAPYEMRSLQKSESPRSELCRMDGGGGFSGDREHTVGV